MKDGAPVPLEYRVVGLQTILVAAATVIAALTTGSGLAVLVGGGCALIPNAFMALRARRGHRAGTELASAAGMFLAMLTKLGLTVLLLALALKHLEHLGQHSAGGFFTGFIVALLAHHAAFLMKDASHDGIPPAPPEPDVDDGWGKGDTGPDVRRRDTTDSQSDRG